MWVRSWLGQGNGLKVEPMIKDRSALFRSLASAGGVIALAESRRVWESAGCNNNNDKWGLEAR
ncbi:MAG TPA: hypothetical protein EYG15_05100 [Deltaproteobacteria bacterium]|nr:hypothetical protein [Deltaproteobacteria bacterium]HIL15468.1 hypothetical protein [Deltaproteobacteria bacterium]